MENTLKISFLFIFLFLSLISQSTSKWTITVSDPSQPFPFVISKGFFTNLKVTVSSTDPNEPRASGILSIPQGEFVLSDDITIDTHISTTYDIYLGTSCSSNVEYEKMYEITLTIDGDEFEIQSFNVTIAKAVQEISITKRAESVGNGAYGLYDIVEGANIKNVDMVNVTFSREEQSSEFADVEGTSLDAFSMYNQRKTAFRFYTTKYEEGKEAQSFSLEIKSVLSKECFELRTTEFSFKTTKDSLIKFDETKRSNILKSFSFPESPLDNTIDFTITKFPYTPSLISCVIQSHNSGAFPTDEAIRALSTAQFSSKSPYLNYYQHFFSSEETHTISFDNLSRNELFRMKCVIDNAAFDEEKLSSISITIGDINSDINVPLKRKNKIKTNTICGSWQFEDWVDKEPFTQKLITRCDDAVKTDFYNKGCVRCIKVDITLDKSSSVCVQALPSCNTDYDGEVQPKFTEIYSKLLTKEDIKKEFDLENYEVKSVSLLEDANDIDISKIDIKMKSQTNTTLELSITNNNDFEVTCYPHKLDQSNIDKVTLFDFDLTNNNENTMKTKETIDITLEFEGKGYDDKIYSVIFTCSDNILTKSKLHQTEPFLAFTVIHTEKQKEDDEPSEKHNCTASKFNTECIQRNTHKLFELKSKNPKVDHSEYLNMFEHLTNPSQQIALEGEEAMLTELMKDVKANKQAIIDEIIFIAELISRRKCDTFVNYAKCMEIKKKYIDTAIKSLNQMYTCSSLYDDLISTGDQYPLNLKRYLIAIFEITNNADSYQESNFCDFYNMTECAFNYTDKFLEKIEDKDTKIDIKKLFPFIMANLFDAFPYAEIDYYITFKHDDDLLKNSTITNLRTNIESSLKKLWSEDNNFYVFDNIEILFTKKKEEPKSNEAIAFVDSLITISIKEQELLTAHNRDLLQYIVYKNYPYLAVNNTYLSKTFVSISIYNETTGQKGYIPDIEKDLRPRIIFSKERYNETQYPYCYNFDVRRNQLLTYGITKVKTESEIECEISLFSDFTIGGDTPPLLPLWLLIVLISVGGALLIIGGILIYCFCIKESTDPRISQINPESLYRSTDASASLI